MYPPINAHRLATHNENQTNTALLATHNKNQTNTALVHTDNKNQTNTALVHTDNKYQTNTALPHTDDKTQKYTASFYPTDDKKHKNEETTVHLAATAPAAFTWAARINNTFCEVLVDTGAATSFIDKAFATKCKLAVHALPTPIVICFADGRETTIASSAQGRLDLHGRSYKVDLLVTDIKHQVILGLSWLRDNKMLIDFSGPKPSLTPSSTLDTASLLSSPMPSTAPKPRPTLDTRHLGVSNTPTTETPDTRHLGVSNTPTTETLDTRPLGVSNTPTTETPDTRHLGVSNTPTTETLDTRPMGIAKTPMTMPQICPTKPDHGTQSHSYGLSDDYETASEGEEPPTISAIEMKRLIAKEPIYLCLMAPIPMSAMTPSTPDPTLQALLEEFSDVLQEQLPPGLPPERNVVHEIPLIPDADTPARPPYRMNPIEMRELKKQLQALVEKGHLRPSSSPYAAPVLFTKKKTGELRLCADYRQLNKLSVKSAYPLPNIDTLLEQLWNCRVFTKLDFTSGYNQIRIAEQDIYKSAITTPFGLWEYTVLPFGMCNAPATFTRAINDVFRPLSNDCVLTYLDDLLVYSTNRVDHMKHLRAVLEILREQKFYAKPSKCAFMQQEVTYLGHTISASGIRVPDDDKAVEDWPTPRNVAEVRSFLGLAAFYSRFVSHFAERATPLTQLTRANIPFHWTHTEETAFQDIKYRISHAPTLKIADPTKDYVIHCDASARAVGGVLSQTYEGVLHPVSFTSRRMKEAEERYLNQDKELLALVHCLTKWRHIILGSKIQVYTDNRSVQYMMTKPTLSQRQARWLDLLSEYNLEILPIRGKCNIVADALSRRPDYSLAVVSTVVGDTQFLDNVRAGYATDSTCTEIIAALNSGTGIAETTLAHYRVDDGLLYFRSNLNWRLYVPNDKTLREQLLAEHHDSPLAGHMGLAKTYGNLADHFYWPGMQQTVERYVSSCSVCLSTKHSNRLPAGLLHPIDVPLQRFENISLDFVTGLPKSKKGNDAITVIIDRLSRLCHLIPTKTKVTAKETAQLFYVEFIRHHGVPKTVVSDRDVRFVSAFWQSLFEILGSKLCLSTAFHPESNAMTERCNQSVEKVLRAMATRDDFDWEEALPTVEIVLNNTRNASTGLKPYLVAYGREPTFSPALLFPQDVDTNVPAVREFVDNLANIAKIATDNTIAAQASQAKFANHGRREESFEPGDIVWLSSKNIHIEAGTLTSKLQPKYLGPFEITRRVSDVDYALDLPAHWKKHPVFHTSLLKRHVDHSEEFPNRHIEIPEPDIASDGELEYEVQRILQKRERKYGRGKRTEYLVKWKGYDDSSNSWEPMSNLQNVPRLIKQFEKSAVS
jgi:predicted aspartyl protease/transposase InsO family protein